MDRRMPETKSWDFVFLRHGESVGNTEGRFQGQADYPLTAAGREQARALGARWGQSGRQFDLILTSPLVRALETAEIIARSTGTAVEVDPAWSERNVGEISGLTRAEAMERFPESEGRKRYDPVGRSGEGDWELFLRAGRAVQGLLRRPYGSYVVVTHGGLLDKVLYAILGIPVQSNSNGPSFRFENAGYATFRYDPSREQWRMLQLAAPTTGI